MAPKLQDTDFSITDWTTITSTEHPGETGKAFWKTVEKGNWRLRIVEYTPGYRADHWCSRGHIVFVLEGQLVTELQDGKTFTLSPGMSYQVADDQANPHKSSTETGAKLFIVD